MENVPYLSVIIPAYNEAERLPETLALVRDYLECQTYSYEVLVVDDGSTDETVKLTKRFAQRFPALRVIENQVNKGKGGVVQQGMLEALGQWRLFMDADHSTPITELDKFWPATKQFQVVIGSRHMSPGSIKIKQPLTRRIVSRVGNWLIQRAVLPGVVDTQCGFKLFSGSAAQTIFPRQTMNGWAFDVEVLTIAHEFGYKIKEVPVDWYDAKESKLRAMHAAINSFRDVRAIRKRVKAKAYK